ncbi:MAG: hypothetical protein JWO84_503 [Parcubacteria group bacterium]|nr:hypothetical protein [Parcubacteria group bacterium]
MPDPELLAHVTRMRASGISEEEIRRTLSADGRSLESINGALALLKLHEAPPLTRGRHLDPLDVAVPSTRLSVVLCAIGTAILIAGALAFVYAFFRV